MNSEETRFINGVCRQLEADGYRVHAGAADDGEELEGKRWFS